MAALLNGVIAAIVSLYFVMIGGWRRYSLAALIAIFIVTWIAVFVLLTVTGASEGIMK
jgi:hypothetical protein